MSDKPVDESGLPLRKNRQFLLLVFSQTLGMYARGIYFILLPLYVLGITDSTLSMGISLLLAFAPYTLAGPLVGYVVDRFSRRDMLVITNLLYGGALFFLPFVSSAFPIYVVAFAASVFGVFIVNCISALLPNLVPGENLAKANSLYTAMRSATFLLSAATAYFLINAMGKQNLFLVCGALILISGLACLLLGRDTPRETGDTAGEGARHGGGVVVEAFRIMWSDRYLRGLMLMHFLFMPVFGAFEVYLPAFSDAALGQANYYALLSGAMGGGLTLGSLLAYRALARLKPLKLVFLSFFFFSTGALVLTRSAALAASMATCFFIGLSDGLGFTTYEYLRQHRVPADFRGRVFALMDALILLPMPVGYLCVGYFAERAGIITVGLWIGVLGICVSLVSFALAGRPRM